MAILCGLIWLFPLSWFPFFQFISSLEAGDKIIAQQLYHLLRKVRTSFQTTNSYHIMTPYNHMVFLRGCSISDVGEFNICSLKTHLTRLTRKYQCMWLNTKIKTATNTHINVDAINTPDFSNPACFGCHHYPSLSIRSLMMKIWVIIFQCWKADSQRQCIRIVKPSFLCWSSHFSVKFFTRESNDDHAESWNDLNFTCTPGQIYRGWNPMSFDDLEAHRSCCVYALRYQISTEIKSVSHPACDAGWLSLHCPAYHCCASPLIWPLISACSSF